MGSWSIDAAREGNHRHAAIAAAIIKYQQTAPPIMAGTIHQLTRGFSFRSSGFSFCLLSMKSSIADCVSFRNEKAPRGAGLVCGLCQGAGSAHPGGGIQPHIAGVFDQGFAGFGPDIRP